jgi:cardiolipin synthase
MFKIPLSYRNYTITFSTLLTLVRIVLVPFICGAFFYGDWFFGTFLFAIAGITDVLDGFCARLLAEESFIGALLDPLADKILMIAVYTALFFSKSHIVLPGWFLGLVLGKEIVQIIGMALLLWRNGMFIIKPLKVAKITMAVQWLFVLIIGISSMARWQLAGIFEGLLGLIVVLIGVCFYYYSQRAYTMIGLFSRYSRAYIVLFSLTTIALLGQSDSFFAKKEPKKKLSAKKTTEQLLRVQKKFLSVSNAIIEQLSCLNQEYITLFEAILVGDDAHSTDERAQLVATTDELNQMLEQCNKKLLCIKK